MPRGVYDRHSKRSEPQAARGANPGAAPGRAEATQMRCKHCRYFDFDERQKVLLENSRTGDCMRYPEFRVKFEMNKACGEFGPRDAE